MKNVSALHYLHVAVILININYLKLDFNYGYFINEFHIWQD